MTKIAKLWHRYSFWQRLEKASFYIGTTVTGTLVLSEVDKIYTIISLGSTIVGGLIGIIFNDDNKDGISDIFQGNGHTIK
jgi:hypothetical protein